MTVDWRTLKPDASGGFMVQDINEEDWFDVEEHFNLRPGDYIYRLQCENADLRRLLTSVKQTLRADPAAIALRLCEAHSGKLQND